MSLWLEEEIMRLVSRYFLKTPWCCRCFDEDEGGWLTFILLISKKLIYQQWLKSKRCGGSPQGRIQGLKKVRNTPKSYTYTHEGMQLAKRVWQKWDFTKVENPAKWAAGLGLPLSLEDKAPWTSWMFNLQTLHIPTNKKLEVTLYTLQATSLLSRKYLGKGRFFLNSWNQEKSREITGLIW